MPGLRQSRHRRPLRDLPRPASATRRAICVVEDLADLWALERTGAFRGRYHVLGGTLSALDGVGPEDLNIARLIGAARGRASELILALNATVDGQTTAHYIADRAAAPGVTVSRLAQGVPIGGELDYLDDGTLTAALKARRARSVGRSAASDIQLALRHTPALGDFSEVGSNGRFIASARAPDC